MKSLRLGLAISLLAATPAAVGAATATDPERQIMTLVNQARAARGLAPLRSDYRLWLLADERSAAMAATGELSHSAGGSLQSGLGRRGFDWYGYGEVIAYTSVSGSAAARSLFDLWASSPPHWALLTNGTFNYLGVAMAKSSAGLMFGSIVLTEAKDRTGARATVVGATVSGDDIRWTWRGADPVLQTHTAGLRDFTVQQRTDRGNWVTITTNTKSIARTSANRSRGHWYGLRVRARDRAGNIGAWSPEFRVRVP